jgi:anti-sigma regulatory factor (Ser/Thr protein kinase)
MIAIAVNEASQVAEARRMAVTIARSNGLGEVDAGRLALVATELSTNLIKHGGGGELLVGAFDDQSESGIEILALDRGRGIANVASCLVEGYSSADTPGNGLGAAIRQSNFFDIASWPGVGTAVLARVTNRAPGKRHHPVSSWAAVSVAMAGQAACGDSWTVLENADGITLFVADGLGHGQEAAEASVAAVRLFHRFNGHQVATLLDYVHGGLRSTRGAAVSLARFDRATGRVIFGGIGNVAGALVFDGTLKRMVSMPGTAGHNARKIQSFDYPFQSGLVILNSDGLSTGWSLARYPNLEASHPTLIAAILNRDFGRNRDDTTVLVGKWLAKKLLESDPRP